MSNHSRSKKNRNLLKAIYKTRTNAEHRPPCLDQFKNLLCCLLSPHDGDHVAASGETWPQRSNDDR
jgi:hypothetical protein